MRDLPSLFAAFRNGDRAALARLITRIEDGRDLESVESSLLQVPAAPGVIAVTGAPGAGKSVLVAQLAAALQAGGKRVGVLAIDPDSPITGGALLGDRVRMAPAGEDLFIRSLSARGGTGGISPHTAHTIQLMRAFGFDRVLVETVGAGQGDHAVVPLADVTVLVTMPGAGDAVQWEKAGLAELAKIVVVNKSDLPGAEALASVIHASLSLGDREAPPILLTTATKGDGISALADAIEKALNKSDGSVKP
jgi:LAO/AO transport system kinase